MLCCPFLLPGVISFCRVFDCRGLKWAVGRVEIKRSGKGGAEKLRDRKERRGGLRYWGNCAGVARERSIEIALVAATIDFLSSVSVLNRFHGSGWGFPIQCSWAIFSG